MLVDDVPRRMVLAQAARRGPCGDCAILRPLVKAATRLTQIRLVLAYGEFESDRNHHCVQEELRAHSVIRREAQALALTENTGSISGEAGEAGTAARHSLRLLTPLVVPVGFTPIIAMSTQPVSF